MKKLKRYILCALGTFFLFGSVIPYFIAWSLDTKGLGIWLSLAVNALAPLPFVIMSWVVGFLLFQTANEKYPTSPSTTWINFQRSVDRAGHHLGRTLGFFMITAVALLVLKTTGWWDIFDPSKSVSDWPWYNFVALLLGGGFAGYLIYHAIKHLGDRD
jgi:hypothetical protein